ncbi:MAG: DUF4340 domain-containing protein [Oceanipulchritudo sp.]
MRFKLTILLLTLNVALFGLIFYIDKVRSTRSLYDSDTRLILDPLFLQGLDKIEIASSNSDIRWEFDKEGAQTWLVRSPIHWKANPYAIQQLLFQLKTLAWESRFPVSQLPQAGQSLESYDLEAPPLRITLHNGASSLPLQLGAPTEIGNRLYMMSPDGEYILVISRGLLEILQREMESFLDKRIFGLGIEESRVIQIQDRSASNVRVRLERGREGWRFISPIEAPGDTERVEAMIREWQGMEVEWAEERPVLDPGLEGNAIRLTFEGLNERETLILAPTALEGETFHLAKREAYGAVFKVGAEHVERLQNAQEELREKRILHQHAADWTSLKIEFGELSTTLQQLESGEWQVLYTSPGEGLRTLPADSKAIEEVRTLVRTMEAVRFVSDAPSENDLIRYGLDQPQRRISLRKASGAGIELRIGGVSSEGEGTLLYGTTTESASVFLLRPHILAGLPLDPLHYRERTIFSLPDPAGLADIRLLERASGADLLSGEVPPEAGTLASIRETLSAYLHAVEVESYLDSFFSDPLRAGGDRLIEWPWLLEADVTHSQASTTAEGTEQKVRFHISRRLGGTTQYIGDPASGLVGKLPVDIIECLDPLLVRFPENPGPPPETGEPASATEPEKGEQAVIESNPAP